MMQDGNLLTWVTVEVLLLGVVFILVVEKLGWAALFIVACVSLMVSLANYIYLADK